MDHPFFLFENVQKPLSTINSASNPKKNELKGWEFRGMNKPVFSIFFSSVRNSPNTHISIINIIRGHGFGQQLFWIRIKAASLFMMNLSDSLRDSILWQQFAWHSRFYFGSNHFIGSVFLHTKRNKLNQTLRHCSCSILIYVLSLFYILFVYFGIFESRTYAYISHHC